MTTTAAGDAAVARLNKATEAFEKIITGASNQVVDVPGYGNQPTLAARVDERLDETTATAAAEADRSRDEADRATTQANAAANSVTLAAAEYNKAQIQADRAQSEADRAAQITGLDTVSDAVALAALPLPDVWAPLSDSLRMITGYGRDVLVGSDVVARMVNFSRNSTATYIGKDGQLKTAAANEPRFEKEGLLIEGQSTNLVPNSKKPPPTTSETGVTLVASPYGDVFKFAAATTNNSMKEVKLATLTAGQLVTVSFIAKKAEIDTVAVGFDGMYAALFNLTSVSVGGVPSGSSATITPIGDGFYRVTLTTTTTRDVTPSLRLKVNGTFVANAVGDGMLIGNIQAELLPFASSYIPTSGAAVTRAADICSIVKSNNFPADGVSAWAVTVSQLRCDLPSGVLAVVSMDALSPSRHIWFNSVDSNGMPAAGSLRVGTFSAVAPKFGIGVLALSTSKTEASCMSGGVITKIPIVNNYQLDSAQPIHVGRRIGGGSDGSMYGHVRNLRIWHRTLTDAQLKAIS